MKLAGIRSPGRRGMRAQLRKVPVAFAKNCPDIFAEDAEFMRLFRESKRLEGLKSKKDQFDDVMAKLKQRGWWLEKQAAARGTDA